MVVIPGDLSIWIFDCQRLNKLLEYVFFCFVLFSTQWGVKVVVTVEGHEVMNDFSGYSWTSRFEFQNKWNLKNFMFCLHREEGACIFNGCSGRSWFHSWWKKEIYIFKFHPFWNSWAAKQEEVWIVMVIAGHRDFIFHSRVCNSGWNLKNFLIFLHHRRKCGLWLE